MSSEKPDPTECNGSNEDETSTNNGDACEVTDKEEDPDKKDNSKDDNIKNNEGDHDLPEESDELKKDKSKVKEDKSENKEEPKESSNEKEVKNETKKPINTIVDDSPVNDSPMSDVEKMDSEKSVDDVAEKSEESSINEVVDIEESSSEVVEVEKSSSEVVGVEKSEVVDVEELTNEIVNSEKSTNEVTDVEESTNDVDDADNLDKSASDDVEMVDDSDVKAEQSKTKETDTEIEVYKNGEKVKESIESEKEKEVEMQTSEKEKEIKNKDDEKDSNKNEQTSEGKDKEKVVEKFKDKSLQKLIDEKEDGIIVTDSPSETTEDMVSDSDEIEVLPLDKDKDTDSITSIPQLQEDKSSKKEHSTVPTNNGDANADGDSSDSSIEFQYTRKRKKIVHVWQCINPKCSETSKRSNLLTAKDYELSVYNYEYDPKKKRKICVKCYGDIMKEQARLIKKIDDKDPLMNEDYGVAEDVLELEDSDEKSETDSSESSYVDISCDTGDENIPLDQFINKKFASLITDMDISSLITSSCVDLNTKFEEMDGEREDITKKYKNIERGVEKLMKDMYQPFEPKIKELEPLDIPVYEKPRHMIRQPPPVRHPLQRPMGNAGIAGRQHIRAQHPMGGAPFNRQPMGMRHPGQIIQQQQPVSLLPEVPPSGPLEKPPLTLGAPVYHLRGNQVINIWKEGKVDEILSAGVDQALYKIKFENYNGSKKIMQSKQRNLKQLAYFNKAKFKIDVGTRVIALYQEKPEDPGSFYAGIIAEPPKSQNHNRYLIFFDDGVTRYVEHKDVRVICLSSDDVSEDVHINSKQFIKEYLANYPDRPMVKLKVGQAVKTEYDSSWHITRVAKVDASLVSLYFEERGIYEWLYRGSTRLGPLFTELQNQKTKLIESQKSGKVGPERIRRMGPSNIEYTTSQRDRDTESGGVPGSGAESAANFRKQNVARKSMKSSAPRSENTAATENLDREGNVNQVDISNRRTPGKPFSKHQCSPKCIEDKGYTFIEEEWKGTNTLLIPLYLGWDRQVYKLQGVLRGKVQNKTVLYKAPCGRSLRNLEEVHRYLRITKSTLEIDYFNMEWFVKVFDEWSPQSFFNKINDLSYGKENYPVPSINSIDKSYPEHVEYSTVRLPQQGVIINTDPEFLVGCNCIDDCQDTNNCACHQLTIQATAHCVNRRINPNAVYKFRRLLEFVPTGIYECNKQCKCAKTCLNRVAQNPLRNKLQVFKTKTREWGIRTLCDIPKGGFICIYVGKLFGLEDSNFQGQNHGDEYFADLDNIEMVERFKDGYEEDVVEPSDNEDPDYDKTNSPLNYSTEDEDEPLEDDDKEFVLPKNKQVSRKSSSNRSSRNRFPQVDGVNDYSDMSLSDEETIATKASTADITDSTFAFAGQSVDDTTASGCSPGGATAQPTTRSTKRKINMNDLISKPDPFLNGMVVKKKWSEVTEDDILVQHPSQVDGANDDSDDDLEITGERRPLGAFSAPTGMSAPKRKEKFKSTRKFFGADEEAYTMDAKQTGNIGRYLNHCCEPNCFVQSVYVDTHDLRFHWVSFFAHTHISAGSELHWDYGYEVNSIPGRNMICKCGAEKCRVRLL